MLDDLMTLILPLDKEIKSFIERRVSFRVHCGKIGSSCPLTPLAPRVSSLETRVSEVSPSYESAIDVS